ncbi:MAG: hypothetical protein LBF60_05055 [Treponema sp.]|nr:hypothetical protein [Treponema sp.]
MKALRVAFHPFGEAPMRSAKQAGETGSLAEEPAVGGDINLKRQSQDSPLLGDAINYAKMEASESLKAAGCGGAFQNLHYSLACYFTFDVL